MDLGAVRAFSFLLQPAVKNKTLEPPCLPGIDSGRGAPPATLIGRDKVISIEHMFGLFLFSDVPSMSTQIDTIINVQSHTLIVRSTWIGSIE